ncbi:MAG: hypothetical protein PSN34_15275 [Urechidicola sp.]|nr:hypothetical protein [Urechidicola sp.]
MKTIFLLLLSMILFLSCSSHAKQTSLKNIANQEVDYIPYYLKVYEADSLYIIGDFVNSYKILDSIFEIYEPLNQDVIYEMETYINVSKKTNNVNKIKPILKKLISIWGYDYEYLEKNIKQESLLSNIEIAELKNEYNNKINWGLRDSIINMNVLDQKFRRKKNDFSFSKKDSIDTLMNIDQKHYKIIMNLLRKGSVDSRVVGNRTRKENTSLHGLLIHCIDEDKDGELAKIVYKKVLLGELNPIDYAAIVDRNLLTNNLPQKYFVFSTKKISDVEKNRVNTNRLKIGLPRIGYSKWKVKQLYNNN